MLHAYPRFRTALSFRRRLRSPGRRCWIPPPREAATGYPPYNIERTGDHEYRIEIAVAGFKPDELAIELKESVLVVQGRKAGQRR